MTEPTAEDKLRAGLSTDHVGSSVFTKIVDVIEDNRATQNCNLRSAYARRTETALLLVRAAQMVRDEAEKTLDFMEVELREDAASLKEARQHFAVHMTHIGILPATDRPKKSK